MGQVDVIRQGWERHVNAILGTERPFRWGTQDCANIAARCVKAKTGVDLTKTLAYRSEFGARRLYCRGGLANCVAGVAHSTFQEIAPLRATHGDVVVFDDHEGETIGVIDSRGRIVAPAPDGKTHRPLAVANRAWRIE